MKLACNIDARGKAVRLRLGLIELVLAALVALVAGVAARSTFGWAIAAALALGGAFSVFEARAGWCALRALGVRTRV